MKLIIENLKLMYLVEGGKGMYPPGDSFLIQIGLNKYSIHQNSWDGRLMIMKISPRGARLEITLEGPNYIGIK